MEVAQFDEELLARQRVRPGITGLWQVEARDSASFQAYQRLDLFYVENWSVSLDLAILLSTVQTVAIRSARALRRRTAPAADSATVSWLLD
jgi:lipopolysaccharide/colanic/teichoic acid biosynthesis glycosyltransferase